ncbi:MAG: SPOR domain-containing protein [Paludibacter sp.]|nr:SPOR domain-containing protein [Paludibacter sp.]
MKDFFLVTLLVFLTFESTASVELVEKTNSDSTKNAFQKISQKEKASDATVNFHQDSRIEQLVVENASRAGSIVNGFRVQVFSSNAQRTAKDEAFYLERVLQEAFPEKNVYVTYSSPFWKVRVGDFMGQKEAKNFTEELLMEFPRLKGQTYTVRDRISVSAK